LRGVIKDGTAAKQFRLLPLHLNTGAGKLSDSSGGFVFHLVVGVTDTLRTNVGYEPYKKP